MDLRYRRIKSRNVSVTWNTITCSIVGDKKVHFHPTKCTYQVSIYLSLLAFLLKFSSAKVNEVDIFRPCIALKKTATRAGLVWSLAIRFAQWNSNCRERKHKWIYIFLPFGAGIWKCIRGNTVRHTFHQLTCSFLALKDISARATLVSQESRIETHNRLSTYFWMVLYCF